MDNTPKRIPRLSYTRSQASISQRRKGKSQGRKTYSSLNKSDRMDYQMILNKMLRISQLKNFLSLASSFVDIQILLGKQQPNRFKQTNIFTATLLSDGVFIKKLAQLSINKLEILSNFRKHIHINKKIFQDYQYALLNKQQQENLCQERQTEDILENSQTKQQREFRLLGYSKPENIQNDRSKKKTNIIPFSEFVKSNKKVMQNYQKNKKKYEMRQQLLKKLNNAANKQNPSQQQNQDCLKRSQRKQQYLFLHDVQKLQKGRELEQIEKKILQNYPNIKYIINKDSQKIKDMKIMQKLGEIQNFIIDWVLVQFQNTFNVKFNQNQDKTTVQFAIVIHKKSESEETKVQLQNNQPYIFKKLYTDFEVQIYLQKPIL